MAQRQCSFCGKQKAHVGQLIAGPGVYICDECVALCQAILADGLADNMRPTSATATRGRSSHREPLTLGLTEEALRSGLEALSYRERRVLELRYGLGGEHPRGLDEIGTTFGLAPEIIEQITSESLKKLQSRAGPQR